eukprot:g4226.t1
MTLRHRGKRKDATRRDDGHVEAERNSGLLKGLLFEWKYFPVLAALLLVFEGVACAGIVTRASYTKVDWDAYMQEVEGVVRGDYNYSNLRGETGPLVYPAGFVYAFAALRWVSGGNGEDIRTAQWCFAAIYMATQTIVLAVIYRARPQRLPPWACILLVASKRMHSIYMLRMFNDAVATLFLYAGMFFFVHDQWTFGCILYSAACSIKMNVLLFAPALLVLLLQRGRGITFAIQRIAICAALQFVLAVPFLMHDPVAYISGALRGFGDLKYKWTVNWKFLSEDIFFSPYFAPLLLLLHLFCLVVLFRRQWSVSGLFLGRVLAPQHVLATMVACNFAGVVFARSLHFQFYTWYFHSLPMLAYHGGGKWYSAVLLLVAFGLLEVGWSYGLNHSTGTSTMLSSLAVQIAHALLLSNVVGHSSNLQKSNKL